MKKYALLVMVAILFTPGVALSKGGHGKAQNRGGDRMGQNGSRDGQGMNSAQFQTRKNKILQRLNNRIHELQRQESCIQAASNREALTACMPRHREQRNDRRQGGQQPDNQRQGDQR